MLLHFKSTGYGPPVVVLHGIAGSLRYWDDITPLLASDHRVIAIDLLGFGRSPYPKSDYSYKTHIESIKQTLDSIGINQPIILVGHSMGGLLALRFGATYPSKVTKLVLISMPVYENSTQAKADITKNKKYLQYAYYGFPSKLLCNVWCRALRPISQHVAPFYLQALPRHIAQDSVFHRWQSFSNSLNSIIQEQSVLYDCLKILPHTTLLYGDLERSLVLQNVKKLTHCLKPKSNVTVNIIKGSHHLPLTHSYKVAEIITGTPGRI